MYTYTTYGLQVHSALPLPELVASEEKEADLIIQRGKIDHTPGETDDTGRYAWAGDGELYLYWERVGSFLIEEGCRITVDPQPDVEEALVRLCLLGPVLGPLLHQRGFLALHASAVAINGAVVGFLGHKGWGKSTTAAALHRREHPFVADDILAVKVEDERPQVMPGFPRFKLWPRAATALGEDTDALQAVHQQTPKRFRSVSKGFSRTTLPLQVLYVLGRGPELSIEPLEPQAAFLELTRHVFSRGLIKLRKFAPAHLRKCSALVQSVPVRRLRRTASLEALPSMARKVEEDAALAVEKNNRLYKKDDPVTSLP